MELGTHAGTSFLAFCQAVRALGLDTRCYAVDTWQGDAHTLSYNEDVYQSLAAYHGRRYSGFSKLIRSTFDQALDLVEDGSVDLLHVDGLHTYEAVRHDFESWLPKLSPRAVVLFHDTNIRGGDFGVFKFWDEMTRSYPNHFGFMHCYGLGVLGVGTELPPPVQNFFAMSRTTVGARMIRDIYVRLGSHCSATVVHAFVQEAARKALAAPTEAERINAVHELQQSDYITLRLTGELVETFLGLLLDGRIGIPDAWGLSQLRA